MAIDDERGEGTMNGENDVNGFANDVEGGVGKLAFREDRRETRGGQQEVAFTKRDLQLLRETQEHVAAGRRTACFEEAEVPGGNFCFGGEIELTQTTAATPLAQQIANWPEGSHKELTITWV